MDPINYVIFGPRWAERCGSFTEDFKYAQDRMC